MNVYTISYESVPYQHAERGGVTGQVEIETQYAGSGNTVLKSQRIIESGITFAVSERLSDTSYI